MEGCVPMPTRRLLSLASPRTMQWLQRTFALYPMAMELETCVLISVIPAFEPTNVLRPPVVLLRPDAWPKNELKLPLVLPAPAPRPKKAFCCPALLDQALLP